MTQPAHPNRVTIAGGGISGMAAALRLAQRGYAVTLYEAKPWLGGNMGSHVDADSGVYHDVYPHMFSNFYVNFWDIVENELGLKRGDGPGFDFAPRDSFRTLSLAGGWRELKNTASMDPKALLFDMFRGMAGMSPLDMYLYLYSLVDLIVHRFEVRGRLGLSLNGFIRSRPTATDAVASLHDAIVMFIWSVPSAGTSAASYKNFYRHAFGNVQPLLWLLKGSLAEKIVLPLEQRLVDLGVSIHKQTSVEGLMLDGGRVTGMELRRADFDWNTHRVKVTDQAIESAPFDHLVLAVSPAALGELADRGQPAQRLSSVLPMLAHAGNRLPAQPIAVLDLYFTLKIANIPRENVSVVDSDCYFSIIDLSQLWPQLEKENITALTLAASDYWALPSDDEDDNAHHMIRALHRYIGGFKPGQHWGDPDADIDWERSHFHSNKDSVIFVNQVGSWQYRPETHDPAVDNLYFAGDFCRNHIDMATVEAAVTSGINAAAALHAKTPQSEPIKVLHAPIWTHAALGAFKLALAPAAYTAKACLIVRDVVDKAGDAQRLKDLPHDLTEFWGLPAQYLGDVAETLGSIAAGLGSDWKLLGQRAATASAGGGSGAAASPSEPAVVQTH